MVPGFQPFRGFRVFRGRFFSALSAGLLLATASVAAHERFVKHDLKNHLQDGFFMQEAGGACC